MPRQVNPSAFRDTVGLFATGVTVVTVRDGERVHGMTANAFSSVSLDPLLVLVCVDRGATMHTLLPRAGRFALTILSETQAHASAHFASPERPPGRDQFAGHRTRPAPVSGAPVLLDGVAYLDCRLRQMHGGGDHSIVLGEVLALGRLEGVAPLVWYRGGYHELDAPRLAGPGGPLVDDRRAG